MGNDNQAQTQFNHYTGVFSGSNPVDWPNPTNSPTPVPNNSSTQPWSNAYHQNAPVSSSQLAQNPYTPSSGELTWSQFAASTFSKPSPTMNPTQTYPLAPSTSQTISPMAIQPRPPATSQANYTNMAGQKLYQPSQPVSSASQYSHQVLPPSSVPSGSFMTSAGVPTQPPRIDDLPVLPIGQRSTTHPQFSLVQVTSLMASTNSKPISRYVTVGSTALELPHSKGMCICVFYCSPI